MQKSSRAFDPPIPDYLYHKSLIEVLYGKFATVNESGNSVVHPARQELMKSEGECKVFL